jgi:hypothetical protein
MGVGGGMSTEQREFTPSRENERAEAAANFITEAAMNMHGFTAEEYAAWSNAYARYYPLRVAREANRDGRTQVVLWWKSIDGFDMTHFERHGRHFVRQLAVHNLAQLVGATRGGALTAKPNEELRRKIALFKRVQAAREATFEFTGKGKYGGKDVPARLGLGGLQDFTASRAKTHKRPKG